MNIEEPDACHGNLQGLRHTSAARSAFARATGRPIEPRPGVCLILKYELMAGVCKGQAKRTACWDTRSERYRRAVPLPANAPICGETQNNPARRPFGKRAVLSSVMPA